MARSLAETELADGVFWSPDSRHLGFMAGNKLHRIELATGAVKDLRWRRLLRGATWNAEGIILFGVITGTLQRVPADGDARSRCGRRPGPNRSDVSAVPAR